MTEKEARIFLNMAEDDDPLDAMEEELFQFKKFFTSQTIISSTFEAKLKKLKKLDEAGKVVGISMQVDNFPDKLNLENTDVMIVLFQDFQRLKSQLYMALHACNSPGGIEIVVKELIGLQNQYSAFWPEIKSIGSAVVLSKEQDPMELLINLKKLNVQGVETFKELESYPSVENNSIGLESQRLYLLHQKELQWKKMSSEI